MKDEDGTLKVELLRELFAVLERADNNEQRARLITSAAIAYGVDDLIVKKLRSTQYGRATL